MVTPETLLQTLRRFNDFGNLTRRDYSGEIGVERMMELVKTVGTYRTKDFTIDAANEGVYVNFAKWMLGDPTMKAIDLATNKLTTGDLNKGIYLAGPTGSGKTFATEIFLYLSQILQLKIECYGNDEPFHFENIRSDALTDIFVRTGDVSTYKTKRLLCIQDLGSEPQEVLYMGNRVNVLKDILESRGDKQTGLTIITSNYPLTSDQLKQRYGDRVVSRLIGMCNYITLTGNDRRKR